MVINHNGDIKYVYPFYNNYFVSLKTYPNLYCDTVEAMDEAAIDTVLFAYNNIEPENLILDNKVVFSTMKVDGLMWMLFILKGGILSLLTTHDAVVVPEVAEITMYFLLISCV